MSQNLAGKATQMELDARALAQVGQVKLKMIAPNYVEA